MLIAQDPSNLSAGRVDVAVAVLNAATGEPVSDAVVTIRTKHRREGKAGWAYAVKFVSSSRYDAQLKLPLQGTWDISVEVVSSFGKVSVEGLPVNISPPTRSFTSGSLVFVGVFVVLLAGVGYVWWSARRARRRRSLAAPGKGNAEDYLENGP